MTAANVLGQMAAMLAAGRIEVVDCSGVLGPETPLLKLPNTVVDPDSTAPHRSLASRNLQRGLDARLPSGQDIALLSPASFRARYGDAWPDDERWQHVFPVCRLRVKSVKETAAWLKKARVKFTRHEEALRVGPADTCGVLLEFIDA